jgi:hypothetical protein
MKMLIVQHLEDPDAQLPHRWEDCTREDIATGSVVRDDVPALFYTGEEAEAYIAAMKGIIQFGDVREHFRIREVDYDGETIVTYGEVVA